MSLEDLQITAEHRVQDAELVGLAEPHVTLSSVDDVLLPADVVRPRLRRVLVQGPRVVPAEIVGESVMCELVLNGVAPPLAGIAHVSGDVLVLRIAETGEPEVITQSVVEDRRDTVSGDSDLGGPEANYAAQLPTLEPSSQTNSPSGPTGKYPPQPQQNVEP